MFAHSYVYFSDADLFRCDMVTQITLGLEAMLASSAGHCKPVPIMSYLHHTTHRAPITVIRYDTQLCWHLTGRFGATKSRFVFILSFELGISRLGERNFSTWWKIFRCHKRSRKCWNFVAKCVVLSSNDVHKRFENFFQKSKIFKKFSKIMVVRLKLWWWG